MKGSFIFLFGFIFLSFSMKAQTGIHIPEMTVCDN